MSLSPANSATSDFDFIIGDWIVRHRRLNARLCACTEWTTFEGRTTTRKILGGLGNIEDNVFHLPEGEVRAVALRSFDPVTRTWAIWWLSGRAPHTLDVPVVGGFAGEVGLFFANDVYDDRPVTVRFTWHAHRDRNPMWEQAFSDDGGATWETNWYMEFERCATSADGDEVVLPAIDTDSLLTALEDHGATIYVLDCESGEVNFVSYDANTTAEIAAFYGQIEDAPDRFVRVEPIDSATAFTIMEDFVMSLPESVAKTSLVRALERNRPFRRFKDALYDHGPLRDQWHRFHEDRMLEIARAWLVENGIKNTLGALPWRTN